MDPLLDPEARALATRRLASLERDVALGFDRGANPDDLLARAMEQVLGELVAASGGRLRIEERRAEAHPRASIGAENVRYLALPARHELAPFLELLAGLATRPPPAELAAASLEVLIAPTCPSCPQVVSACVELALESPALALTVIDAQYHRDLAGSCTSVPAVIVDGARTVVGQVSKQELRDLLGERGRPGYLLAALASMLQAGRFEAAAPILVGEGGLAAAAELMRTGAMQDRLGLMLLVERVLARDPHALDPALPHLLPLLEGADASLRGDAADLLGKIGAPGAREGLERLLADENPDVREIAEEALAALRRPS